MDIRDTNGANHSTRKKMPNIFMFNLQNTMQTFRKNNVILNEITFQQSLQRKLHFPEFQNNHRRKIKLKKWKKI